MNINDIINNKKVIKIFKNEKGRETIEYECLKCGYIGQSLEYNFKRTKSCPCCNNKIIIKDINSIYATNKEFLKYFKNIEDAYTNSIGSDNKVIFICPHCKQEKLVRLADLKKRGFKCDKCSDGISYPEKFVMELFNQLNLNYKKEYQPEWSNGKKYDFHIPSFNCVIETNGLQHYSEGFERIGENARTYKEEIKNDIYKKNLALSNGIDNYIVIDCSLSEKQFIRNNIINSELNKIFDLNLIDWNECNYFATSNLAKQVYDYKQNNKDASCRNIGKVFNISPSVVSKYINQLKTYTG